MPLRMLNYILLFYQRLIANSKKALLPPVLPILQYNGNKDWKTPMELAELIEKNRIPDKYIPSFSCYPIIEKNYPEEFLLEINNLISAIILLERTKDYEELNRKIERLTDTIARQHPEDIKIFGHWFRSIFNDAETDPEAMARSRKKGEGKMLAERVRKWEKDIFALGEKKGLQKGIEKGKQEGQSEGELTGKKTTLVMQLDYKFGLAAEEKSLILRCSDSKILDKAIKAIFSSSKEEILKLFR